MAAVLRRFLPLQPPAEEDDDGHSVEYSFALEYKGPPLLSDIPCATPIDISRIPTASVAQDNSWLLNLSLPVINPIERKSVGCKKTEQQPESTSSDESSDDADGSCFSSSRSKNCATPTAKTMCPPESPEDHQERVWFQDRMKSSEIVELEPTPQHSSSDSSDYGSPRHVTKSSIVTFREPDSGDVISDDEESVIPEPDLIPVKEKAQKNDKRGLCYRCLTGNRLTEKEVCIVCDAKYCRRCVLRAMGSMPEGRKCIACIGFRIDESKRGSLGKCSRMLKRLLPDAEIKRVMVAEKSCTPNQLPPNLVYVNGEALNQAELALLRSCPFPPVKLRPGCYWYDKVSGYWGKEGQKPSQIISAHLNIGGRIMRNASNGNTNVLINKREITREEVWMLKVAGIQCEGEPHYWVSEDGSYLEEGQKNVMGRLWEKRKTKLVCAMLSLPIPPSIISPDGDGGAHNKPGENALRKLLLVGPDKSGTSTIFKQTKLLYGVGFSEDERKHIKLMIQSNLYGYLGILLEGREQFAEESSRNENSRAKGKALLVEQSSSSGERNQKQDGSTYSLGPRLKAFSDWLLQVIQSGNLDIVVLSAAREYARFVEELWKDGAIQATYDRRNELGKLPRIATYFLERAIEISREDYEPSYMDILYAEGITSSNGLASMDFSFPKSGRAEESIDVFDQTEDDNLRYQLIRVHPRSLGENCKWLEMFEDVNMVVFCVSLTDYDEFSDDKNGISMNKMMASKQFFESIVKHPTFHKKDFLLVLNKFDLLEEKAEQTPLARCEWFRDFSPVISHNHNTGTYVNGKTSVAECAFHYVAVQFKRLFFSLTSRKLFVCSVTGLEQDSVDGALRYAREIMKWEAREITFAVEESSTSIEASTLELHEDM